MPVPRKIHVRLLISLSLVTMLGIMVIQFFWVRNAFRIQNQQFANRIQLGLHNIIRELGNPVLDTTGTKLRYCQRMNNYEWLRIEDLLHSTHLDSLIKQEIGNIGQNLTYVYGIYTNDINGFIYTSDSTHIDNLLKSQHKTQLNCVHQKDPLYLVLFFPDQESIVFNEIFVWVATLWGLILIMLLAVFFVVLSFISEKKLSEMKNDFVNNMTHELKTPVASLSLAAEMLGKPDVYNQPCQVQKYSKIIHEESSRLRNRIEQVLHVTLVERGELALKKQRADINKLIENSIKNFKLLIRQQKGKVITEFQSNLPAIEGDMHHLENVVSNLIDNAIKYTIGPPVIVIGTKLNDNGIIFWVEDNGIGIKEEDLKNIFKRFYRVNSGDVHDTKGFGLGLYYVKTIIDAHHGTIHVKSQPSKGSRFEVFIPFTSPEK